MKIGIVGLGSMGKRRARLIKKYNPDYIITGIDLNTKRCEEFNKLFGIRTYANLKEAINTENFDCVFISTSPSSHSNIIHLCLINNINVFTEINLLSDGYEKNIRLAKERNKTLFLSSTFLYRKEIKYIINVAQKQSNKLNYTYHVGQYLPDWHPWDNYKDFFIGKKETNGCREIFAIELPWIVKAFGEVDKIYTVKNRITDLDIDFNDNYFVIMQHKNGNKGFLNFDVVTRKAVRSLEIYNEDLYITWNGEPDGLNEYLAESQTDKTVNLYENQTEHRDDYNSFIIEDEYYDEICNFFDVLQGNGVPEYTFNEDLKTLSLIDIIEN